MNASKILVPLGSIAMLGLLALQTVQAGEPQSHPKPSSILSALACTSQPVFPTGREELSIREVSQSLERHLARFGVSDAHIDVIVTEDETFYVQVSRNSASYVTELEVDPATTQIIDVNVIGDMPAVKATQETAQPQIVSYRRLLERHMAGDGKPWADWVGSVNAAAICGDDYAAGGPDIGDNT